MKSVLDPSLLHWGPEQLEGRRYIILSQCLDMHLAHLEALRLTLLVPENYDFVYFDLPYQETRFDPHLRTAAQLLWSFLTKHPQQLETVEQSFDSEVTLEPDVRPRHASAELRSSLDGFFGGIARRAQEGQFEALLLSYDSSRFHRVNQGRFMVIRTDAIAVQMEAVTDKREWEMVATRLDPRPDIQACVRVRYMTRYSHVDGARLRQYRIAERLREYLNDIMYRQPDRFWNIIDVMARWAAGIAKGLRAHKLDERTWRLDVHKGWGDRLHAEFDDEGYIVFCDYHEEHDQYKVG